MKDLRVILHTLAHCEGKYDLNSREKVSWEHIRECRRFMMSKRIRGKLEVMEAAVLFDCSYSRTGLLLLTKPAHFITQLCCNVCVFYGCCLRAAGV